MVPRRGDEEAKVLFSNKDDNEEASVSAELEFRHEEAWVGLHIGYLNSSAIVLLIQKSAERYANSTKHYPGRAKQNREATAGTNFSKPRTSLLGDLGTGIAIRLDPGVGVGEFRSCSAEVSQPGVHFFGDPCKRRSVASSNKE